MKIFLFLPKIEQLKVLYISYDGMTDPLGQSQVIPYLAGLSAKGHDFFLISCEKKAATSQEYIAIAQLLKQNNIRWLPVSYTSKPPVISTLLDLRNINNLAYKVIKEQKIETVHCRSYIAALAGLKMKKKYGVKFIFDMRGFWVDERVDGKIWNIKNPLYKLIYNYFKKKENQFLINADQIISSTENAKNEMLKWKVPCQPLPIQVIPCCVDLNLFNRKNINEEKKTVWRKKLNIAEDNFVLSYLGSIGTWYLLDEMLDFFKVLINQKRNSIFLIITGESPQYIIDAAKKKNIPAEKIVVQEAARNEVPELLSLSHISIFFIKPVYSKKASSPAKMGEIMGMGIPLICNGNIGDTDEIIKNTHSGIIVNTFDDKEYLRIAEKIPELLQIPADEICQGAVKYFSLQDGIEKYDSVYRSVS
ncbi:MAG: glycosyltransferase [Bacteroidales bacterium]